jgi:hypothetical protein
MYSSSTMQNKCILNSAFTKKSFSKKQKISTNNKKSSTLKRFIKKLKMPSFASSNTDMQPPIANSKNLTELYNAIITTENKNRDIN